MAANNIETQLENELRKRVIAHVAAEASVDRSAVFKWLNGTRALRLEEAEALARVMGMRLSLTAADAGHRRQKGRSGKRKT